MSLCFGLNLLENNPRPVIKVVAETSPDYILYALLDTGALFPVWNASEALLVKMGATLVLKDAPFGGFGGQTKGNVYTVSISVGEMSFPKLHIIACENKNIDCSLILSATMFDNIRYEIDNVDHKLKFKLRSELDKQRSLVIMNKDGGTQVLCHNTREEDTIGKDPFKKSTSFKI